MRYFDCFKPLAAVCAALTSGAALAADATSTFHVSGRIAIDTFVNSAWEIGASEDGEVVLPMRGAMMLMGQDAGRAPVEGKLDADGLALTLTAAGGVQVVVGELQVFVSADSLMISAETLGADRPLFESIPGSFTMIGDESPSGFVAEFALTDDAAAEHNLRELAGVPLGVIRAEFLRSTEQRTQPPAHSDTTTHGTIGPDVIVSTVGNGVNKYSTIGGITAYAITTVSCNIGDQEAEWFSNNNQHPVIGMNMYRYKDGRMMQIGQSWLKHGFCAADAPSCGSCDPNGSCDWLGLFCTDTYDASLNGSQGNLGPRYDVNPFTGAYNYPFPTQGSTGGSGIAKRLQVLVSDLDPAQNPGALYYGESQYICTDELPAARYNNVSYKRMLVGSLSSGGYSLSFTGSTTQQLPAMKAWTGASFTDINVPGDGRMILAYKVTDLGGGNWRYDYAIYNMNSDRSARSISIPLASGVSASDLGFHDVPYHSGEPFSGTNWPGAVSGSSVSWATDTHATNVNANAVRWGTMYNYWFTANTPPVAGNVTVGLFKPGAPGDMTVAALVPSDPPFEPGDMNCDSEVDLFDVEPMCLAVTDPAAFGSQFPGCDISNGDMNGDTLVNATDKALLCATIGAVPCDCPCPGDLDGNGVVDFGDLNIVLSNWGATGAPGIPGDADESGAVDFGDINLLLGDWDEACL